MSLCVNPAVPDGAVDPRVRLTWTTRTRLTWTTRTRLTWTTRTRLASSPTSKTRAL
jgi:hypothetical protein